MRNYRNLTVEELANDLQWQLDRAKIKPDNRGHVVLTTEQVAVIVDTLQRLVDLDSDDYPADEY